MALYLLRRLGHAILVVFGVSVIVFLIMRVSGDPLAILLGPDATAHDRAVLARELGFDRPLYQQYLSFLGDAVRGRFGESLWYHQPSLPLVLQHMPATIELASLSLLLAVLGAVPLGVWSALRRGSVVDNAIGTFVMLGQSAPIFWVGMLLILEFSVNLRLLPPSGQGTVQQLIMPVLTLGVYSMARLLRLTRSGTLEVLSQDYIRTARAKGLSETAVLFRHGLRNALVPLITYLGLEVGTLLGGTVVVEKVFSWPGVGSLSLQAIFNRDYPLVQAAVFVVALAFVFVNLAVDLLYPVIDPRIRLYGAPRR